MECNTHFHDSGKFSSNNEKITLMLEGKGLSTQLKYFSKSWYKFIKNTLNCIIFYYQDLIQIINNENNFRRNIRQFLKRHQKSFNQFMWFFGNKKIVITQELNLKKVKKNYFFLFYLKGCKIFVNYLIYSNFI